MGRLDYIVIYVEGTGQVVICTMTVHSHLDQSTYIVPNVEIEWLLRNI